MESIKDVFKRYYTKSLEKDSTKTVYDLFQWKKVNVLLKDHKSGKVLTDMKDLEFPISYSQSACDIIASKYFRKAGVPNELGVETSMKMVAHRMVSFWVESLKEENLIKTKEESEIFYDEMVYGLLNQMYAPNSPQWFNTGLALSYGIKGSPQGNFYYDKETKAVVSSTDSYTRTQASACFIVSIEDKLLGKHSISQQYVTETKLFKGGSGTGTNFSSLRAEGEKLSGGGYSSGLMSFLKGFDRNAGAIKSGGTTRRAAKMVCLDIDHPEIEQFISWKAKEEDKVRALGKMGYDADFEGEAYQTVSGQNSNNSLRINDEFMGKVCDLNKNPEATIELKGRVDSRVNKEIQVQDLWNLFNESAWKCADPAPQFSDTFNAWHTCPGGEDGVLNAPYNRLNSTNPCGEYAFLDNTSCNLSSINIYKFYDTTTKKFDLDGYLHIINLNQLLLEASINWGQFPTEDIARRTHLFRTTGLGISNIASLFMVMGYPYNSEEARNIAASLIGIMTARSYSISALMAKEIGAFEKYEINKPYMLKVIKNHARVAGALKSPYEGLNYLPLEVNHSLLLNNKLKFLSENLKKEWSKAVSLGESHGYRNAQVSVIAPTGTISFAMDCAATSIEPFFSHIVYKKLSGGGYMTLGNPIIEESLRALGYSETEVLDILEYITRTEEVFEGDFKYDKIVDGKIEGAPHLKKEHLAIFDTANTCGTGERYIASEGHVKMVAAITPLISGAISKTVNLPKDASIEDFKDIVITSWKLGVKGISLYRDSSKASQPLNTSLFNDANLNLEDLSYKELLQKANEMNLSLNVSRRDKPEGIRTGTTHPAQIDDVKVYTTVNRNAKGEITEIYITTDREGTIITGLLNSLSKSISVMLQYHVPATDIARMLRGQKYEPYGFVQKHPYIKYVSSISDLISKVIDIENDDYSRCQIKPDGYENFNLPISTPIDVPEVLNTASDSDVKSHTHGGERVYGSTCPTCSSTRMMRNGTCMVCLDCGSTTGCS
ncbi:vitamin B12-dependent ribonucleotide reductase [Clostridium algidicarnis]|uniref:vitamin B12-dependent ribonucleotide reductase n=1 Tax=Clostridium algidicarnis TaxID=37659 RepID=UPI001C0ADE7A|nr:vitamin B12-dependent ribonucleotide reductase [Clostridium algidicarnis]MBU3206164.1 vitamin B12-dependent ribonucleotide reductase [Clostridium algidicarnis]